SFGTTTTREIQMSQCRARPPFLRHPLLLSLAVLLLPGCAPYMELFEDGLAALRGEGGTIARSDQLAPTAEHVRTLAPRRPATAWDAAVPHESADLLQFVDER